MQLKKFFTVLCAVVLICSNFSFVGSISAAESTETENNQQDKDWEMVWSDEFDGNEINMDNWSYDRPDNGRYNGEIQSYTENNAFIENGSLILEARKEDITEEDGKTYNYSSAKLITKGKQKWTYGKIEIKAKMPTGQGIWPAIWMMPEDEPFYGTWPVSGEIDIMELLGHKPNEIHGTVHFGKPHQQRQGTYTLPAGQTFADGYHIYAIEWEPGEIRWYIDGELYHTANDWFTKHDDNATDYTYPAPFDQDFFLIMNISVGGGWPGNPDETTEFPQQMAVDYVRVYQKDEYPVHEKPESGDSGEGRRPLEDGNYIYNGSFDVEHAEASGIEGVNYTDYWTYLSAGGKASLKVNDEGALDVQIESGGDVEHAIQLLQSPVTLEKGAKYRASFKAKAEHERLLKVKIGGDGDRGWSDYAGEPPLTITPTWEDYSFAFTMEELTDLKARFEFNMGLDDGDISLDDVKLVKIADAPPVDPDTIVREPLPTGNYIYNGTFDQGTDRFEFWEFHTDETADATTYIGSAVNERRFETRINNGGSEVTSVQLIHSNLNLQSGNSYELTFDASAAADRDMKVSLVNSKFEVIHEEIVNLSPETEEYTLQYTMDKESDSNSELHFNIGGNGNDVYIDNVFMKRLPLEQSPDNLLKNGIFDGLANWSAQAYNPGEATFKVNEEGQAQASITNIGTEDWNIQLFQHGVELEENATYEVSFDAKASVERPLRLQIQHNGEEDNDWTGYFDETVLLNDTLQNFTYTFEMNEPSDAAAKFGFALGKDAEGITPNQAHDVYIDNVTLKKVENTDVPGDGDTGEKPVIENGSLDGLDGWFTEANNGGVATFDAEAGELKSSITEVGTNPWDIQLYQNDFELKEGETYELSFKAKSTLDRTMLVQIQNYDTWAGYVAERPTLSNEYQTFSYQFTMEEVTDSNTRLSFSLGNDAEGIIPDAAHDVYIDDVVIRKVDPGVPDDGGNDPGAGEGIDPGAGEGTDPGDGAVTNPGDSGVTDPEDSDEIIPEDDDEKEQGNVEKVEEENGNEKLPDTATSTYNMLAIGGIVLLMGVVLAIVTRKQKRKMN
ncbi:carbohydrate binding domain-containing protein [Gracilibacillus marinus]|uniref:Carbohydrate binding domain-containing protein n=1 Tax=Gracilibacillus marinus TaxID=630535 RepID=A0ABV8VQA7_9BACI